MGISSKGPVAPMVALPSQTPYLYFRARYVGTDLQLFAVTFEEHLQNACP
jgi:UPF0755 protein